MSGGTNDGTEFWNSGILEFYQNQNYGRIPSNVPNVSWDHVCIDDEGTRLIEGRMGTSPDPPKINGIYLIRRLES
jgi:hypothetical protein